MENSKNKTLQISSNSDESSSEDYESSDAEKDKVEKNVEKGRAVSSSSDDDSDNEIWNRPTNQPTTPSISVINPTTCGRNSGESVVAVMKGEDLSTVSVIRPTNLPTNLSTCSPGTASVEAKNQYEKEVESRIDKQKVKDVKSDSVDDEPAFDKHDMVSKHEESSLASFNKDQSTIIDEEQTNNISIVSNDILDKDVQATENIKMTTPVDCLITLPITAESINIQTNSRPPQKDMDKFIENILQKFSTSDDGDGDGNQEARKERLDRNMDAGRESRDSINVNGYKKGVLSTVVGSVVQNQSKVVRQLKTLATDMDQVQEDLRGMMKDLNSKSSVSAVHKGRPAVRDGGAHSRSRINRNEWLFEVEDNVALDDSNVRTYYQFVRDYSPVKILGSKYVTDNVDDDGIGNYYSRSTKSENKSRAGYQRRNVTFDLGGDNRTSRKYTEDDESFPRISDDYWRRSKNDQRGYCYMCGEFECSPYSHASRTDSSQLARNQTLSALDRHEISFERYNPLKRDELETKLSKELNNLTSIEDKSSNVYLPKSKSKFLKKVQRRALTGEKVTPSEGFQSRFLK